MLPVRRRIVSQSSARESDQRVCLLPGFGVIDINCGKVAQKQEESAVRTKRSMGSVDRAPVWSCLLHCKNHGCSLRIQNFGPSVDPEMPPHEEGAVRAD